ncbi:hypothetical protein BDR07DRAFT_1486139 [Suillus spraguei]|nr:hypothetical protein BDR07DRAFT_1486139 [Suillus spraguei]
MPVPVMVCVFTAIATVATVIAFHQVIFFLISSSFVLNSNTTLFSSSMNPTLHPPSSVGQRTSSPNVELDILLLTIHSRVWAWRPRPSGADLKKRTLAGEEDSVELQGYKLDEWRSQVHHTTQSMGMRRRVRVIPDTDEGSIPQ